MSLGHCICNTSEAERIGLAGGDTIAVTCHATDSEPELLPTETASTIVDRRIWGDLRWLHLHAAQQNNNSAPAIAEDNAMALNSRGEKPAPGGPGVLELVAMDVYLYRINRYLYTSW